MADISQITLPSGSTYYLKDIEARGDIQSLKALIGTTTGAKVLVFKGISSTPLSDGNAESPKVGNTQITNMTVGDIYFYGNAEFIWGENPEYNAETNPSVPQYVWHELGRLTGLGGLAYKYKATGSYQPTGTISNPTFSGSTLTMSTDYTPQGNVTVSVTSSTAQKYAVSEVTSDGGIYQPKGTVSAPTFTGTLATISMSTSYTPGGTVSSVPIGLDVAGATTAINNPTPKPVMMGLATTSPGETAPSNAITYWSVSSETLSLYQIGYNKEDSITTSSVTVKTSDATYKMNGNPTFTGTGATITVSTRYTPAGTNTEPTFTGTTAHLATVDISIPTSFGGTFTGLGSTITVSGTPAGSISQPIFTGDEATIEVS